MTSTERIRKFVQIMQTTYKMLDNIVKRQLPFTDDEWDKTIKFEDKMIDQFPDTIHHPTFGDVKLSEILSYAVIEMMQQKDRELRNNQGGNGNA